MPKKIKPHINTYCTYCKELGVIQVKALWRVSYDDSKRACDEHKQNLVEYEEKRRKLDGDYSEGDYQSWLRV